MQVVRFLNVKDVRQLLTAPGLKTLQEADGTKGGVRRRFCVKGHICVLLSVVDRAL